MTQYPERIVIIGASSAIAEHCARLWCQSTQPAELILVGRRLSTLEPVAKDLSVRAPQAKVSTREIDCLDTSAIHSLADELSHQNPITKVLIAQGALSDQTRCIEDLSFNKSALEINALSPVLFAEAFANHMQKYNLGHIAVIGSVAGDRGRKSNYVYGAAKGLVERYIQGMQHRFAASNVKVTLVKPGPTDTPMTAHLKADGANLAAVEDVAQAIVNGMARGKAVVYAPTKWRLIMLIIQHLPRFIFNKLDI